MAWRKVGQDLKQEDQLQETLDQSTGIVDAQLIQNWVAISDGDTNVSTGYLNTFAALNASDGTHSMPTIGSLLSTPQGLFTVTRAMPKRSGPYSFSVQIEAHWKYVPPPSANKSNISIVFSGQKWTQDAYQTSAGVKVTNSAKYFLDPTLIRTFYDEKIEISYSTTIEQSDNFNSIRGKVNNASLTFNIKGVSRTYPERCLCCEDVKQASSFQTSAGASTFQVTAEFTSRADGYYEKVIDQGFYDISGNPLLDNQGNETKTPQNLNGSGGALSFGSDPHYLTFEMEDEADFTAAFTDLS